MESINKQILHIDISFERTIRIAERFNESLIDVFGMHPVSIDGSTWYPHQACQFLKLMHHIHSSFENSIIIERTMQYIKDRAETFEGYFSCRKKK
jgi:putative transposase